MNHSLKRAFITTALCMGLTLPMYAAETELPPERTESIAEPEIEVTVSTFGEVCFESISEIVSDSSYEFKLSLGKDWVLRGIEIFDAEKKPVDFEVIGIYEYSFIMPESSVEIVIKSEDRSIASRSDAIRALWETVGKPYVNYIMPFEDIDADADYAEAVRWAASTGLVSSCDRFRPDDPLTREELAVIAYRFAANCSESENFEFVLSDEDLELDAVDRESISDWAYTAVCWNIENDIMNEFSGAFGYFKPQGSLTRHELGVSVKKLVELVCTPSEMINIEQEKTV